MRLKERIPLFIEKVNLDHLFKEIYKINVSEEQVRLIKQNLKTIQEYWESVPDLRFSQVLVVMGFVPNHPGTWFYKEEKGILLEQGLSLREVCFWGRNKDKEGNILKQTEWVLIKDLTKGHIKAIVDGGHVKKDSPYYNVFMDELGRKKQYSIPISWQSYRRFDVEASSLQEAVEKALKIFFAEPDELYLDDSFEIDPFIKEETGEDFDMEQVYNNI